MVGVRLSPRGTGRGALIITWDADFRGFCAPTGGVDDRELGANLPVDRSVPHPTTVAGGCNFPRRRGVLLARADVTCNAVAVLNTPTGRPRQWRQK
jgi:hypothetical protein